MPKATPSFSVKRPVSVWNQPLKADAKGLFTSLAKAGLHTFTGQWTELGMDAAEGLTALGIEKDAPQLSWILIRNALAAAMTELVRERAPLTEEPPKSDLGALSKRLDEAMDRAEVTVDRSLFERPGSLPLLAELRDPFSEWLQAFGLSKAEGDSIAVRLPSYFVVALHHEWRRNPAAYEPIRTSVETPFTAAAERERAWSLYAARLERQVDEPMLGEAFGLRQIYVPLRAFYVEETKSERSKQELGLEKEDRRVAVDLEREIDTWLAKGPKTDTWRIVSGGPGSGKSSFGKMYAAKLAGKGRQMLFVPLHQFNVSGSLISSVGEFVRLSEVLPYNPLDEPGDGEPFLILFDGLDELSQQGHLAAEVARDFLREVQKVVELKNEHKRRLLVLITGREPVVQANASELRDRRPVLHVLPYLVPKEEWYVSQEEIVSEDQRHLWWRRYAAATRKPYDSLPQELARPDLAEITAQPLLNYLVALSFDRGQLEFARELNLNDIYADLLEAVYSRAYEGTRPHSAIRGMQLSEFIRVLEEIALAAWHGNGRTTTVTDIEQHCKTANLSGLLERFEDGAKAGVTRVLTAFYFREFGRTSGGDRTFEFTHKSFREYLTALRIVRAVQRMESEFRRQQESFDSGWSDKEALRHWAEICGPNPMDIELFRFVHNQVRHQGKEVATRWQKMLCRLISFMLRNGTPMELLDPRPTYQVETRQARNAEEALLAVLNACARETQELSRIDWPMLESDGNEQSDSESWTANGAAAGAWISRLRGQRTEEDNGLALRSLSYLDLSGCVLHLCDLYNANLHGTSLVHAYLHLAILHKADLRGTNLRRATLSWANLYGANLQEANLQEANLQGANLQEANLKGANLRGANLQGASLQEANLEGANLQGANLHSAHLYNTQVSREALTTTQGTQQSLPWRKTLESQ